MKHYEDTEEEDDADDDGDEKNKKKKKESKGKKMQKELRRRKIIIKVNTKGTFASFLFTNAWALAVLVYFNKYLHSLEFTTFSPAELNN